MDEIEVPNPGRYPGWHPDPFGRFERRWWDGRAWTPYAGDASGAEWDPDPLERLDPVGTGRPGSRTSGGVLIGVAGFVLGGVGSIAASALLGDDRSQPVELLVPSLPLWVAMTVACLLAHRRHGTATFADDFGLRFRWVDLASGIVGSVAGRLMTSAATPPVPIPSRRLGDADELLETLHGGWTWLALFLVLCVGAPLFEELLFRGLLQPALVARFGVGPGLASCSVLFGLGHLLGWNGPLTLVAVWAITFGGLALGLIRHYADRLTPAILAHAFFNGQVFLLVALSS